MSSIFDYIPQAIISSPRPIILEIGAARCEDTGTILKLIQPINRGYEYYAFEPDPRNVADIKRLDLSRDNFIHLIPTAIGDANRRMMFHQSSGTNPQFGYEHTLSGSLKRPSEHLQAHPWCKFETQIEVRVMMLDTFFEAFSLPYIDFIWCDVQGAEDMVLAGGAHALSRTHYFYTEYYNREMYEGQISAPEISLRLARLTGTPWNIIEQWPYDILFENPCFSHTSAS